MKTMLLRWAPAVLMGLGTLFTVGLDMQRAMPLRAPLASTLPREVEGFVSRDLELSEEEIRVAGVTDYLMRVYRPKDSTGASAFSVYVGYYDQQGQGKTIHSPKNCLPGAGWEVLASRTAEIATSGGSVTVNRVVLQRNDERALVLYWYQGRGRVQANEYVVKWDLLRDSALKGRSDEALVRIVVPINESEDTAFDLSVIVASEILPSVYRALPS
jgi:EpsI family protein